ncbi:IclR family transcriptional regulator [Oligella sp. MSHR50489EDL]|uniref:IclR family transcriptional regulator n=1 Tax=Oligella sp. MSHR50489EDL TaxID=3139409 RepID=UPI003D8144EB
MASIVNSLARGLDILRCFSAVEPTLSNSEIAAYTRLPRSTVSRLTNTLLSLGYLRFNEETKRYQVGAAVLGLGYAALANLRIIDVARPHMQTFADSTKTLVSLATRDRLSMMYLESCSSDSSLTFKMGRGINMPMLSTSIGRAFLATVSDSERTYLIEKLLEKESEDNNYKIMEKLQEEFDVYKKRGYCRSMGDWKPGVNAIATQVTMKGLDSDLVMLSISGPAFMVSEDLLENKLSSKLLSLSEHIARQFE